jgi:hypothetical protein
MQMTASASEFNEFKKRLKLLISKNPYLITLTLSNIFTMRLLGNKTHGDLAEVGITEFVNQYMYDYKALHVGKDLFRAKESEEDIQVISEISNAKIPISLKAYGDGPLQLSTDKAGEMFPLLKRMGPKISSSADIAAVLNSQPFATTASLHILPLIYSEVNKKCNIMVFDYERAFAGVKLIELADSGNGRKHPVYRFTGKNGSYIFEVRYGGASANALQRGLWTHTKNALPYFDSVTEGWIDYSHNLVLVELFSHALVTNEAGHSAALIELKNSIESIKKGIR